MRWRTVNENVIESDCGYKVLRCTCDGAPTGRFVAFYGSTGKNGIAQVLGGANSPEEARDLCDAHLMAIHVQEEITA